MSVENIMMPVGMECVKELLEEQERLAEINRFCDVRPPHFLLHMDEGNGQTTFVEYITDIFVDKKMRPFGSTDTYLEYKLDGSMDQLRKIRTDLYKSRAVYKDKYNGVVAVHVGALANKHNEPQIPFLLDVVNNMKDSSTFVFIFPTILNRTLEQLIQKLEDGVEDMVKVCLPPYSKSQLAEIAVKKLEYLGVSVKSNETLDIIKKMVIEQNISTAKAAAVLGRTLVQQAVFHDVQVVLELKQGDETKIKKRTIITGGNV